MTLPRDVYVPLTWYLTVTLIVPCLNGAAASSAFPGHALALLSTVACLVGVRLLGARVLQATRARASRT